MPIKLYNDLPDSAHTNSFREKKFNKSITAPRPKLLRSLRHVYNKHLIKFSSNGKKSLLKKSYIDLVSMEINESASDTYYDISYNGYEMTLHDEFTEHKCGFNNMINGVPNEFVNSFGNYVGLKYFLEGIKNHNDVFTYMDKLISHEDFLLIKSMYNSCRYIYSATDTEFEFYDENFGYIVIQISKAEKERYKILCGIGYEAFNNVISSCGKNVNPIPMASWVTGIDTYGDLEIKQFSIKDIHEYNHNFYPFMKGEDISSYAKRYINSKSSILLLIGPPGTAKTNFIRQLLSSTNESVLLTYSEDLKKADKLFSYFYDSPEKFLIIEDADTYIERRDDGNTNMKQLLNITDGLTANPDKKVIFSTNLPSLNRVEPALLRPGRCFDKLEFSALHGNDLLNVINEIGSNYFNGLDTSKGYTIAELFAIKNNEQVDIVSTSSKFGFNSQ